MNRLKAPTFLLGLMPLVYSVMQIYLLQTGGDHQLGADPGKSFVMMQGEWTLRFLIMTLMVTPVREITGWTRILGIRRMLGLFTFFYASLHLSSYLVLLLELDLANIVTDVVKRPYITVGFTAYLLLVPLAVTSNAYMVRRLKRRWKVLHRAVYLIAVLAIVHLTWLSKASYLDAFVYGSMVFLLLGYRLFAHRRSLFRKELKSTL